MWWPGWCNLHPQTLRYYDRIGLMQAVAHHRAHPALFAARRRAPRKISRLTDDLGVNLAGVEVIINMSERIEELQQELDALQGAAPSKRLQHLTQRLQSYGTQRNHKSIR